MRRLRIASAAAAIVCAAGLAACAQTSPTVTNTVAAAEIGLTEAERLALIYTSLPRCAVPARAPCSDGATVASIKRLDNQAYAAVKAAEGNPALLSGALAAVGALRAAIPQ